MVNRKSKTNTLTPFSSQTNPCADSDIDYFKKAYRFGVADITYQVPVGCPDFVIEAEFIFCNGAADKHHHMGSCRETVVNKGIFGAGKEMISSSKTIIDQDACREQIEFKIIF